MGRRNPILLVGEPVRQGFTLLCNDLIRDGAHDKALGADGMLVMAYLLSCATPSGSGKRVWETSAAQMAELFGWPANRRRITKAIEAAKKDGRLLIREYVRDGVRVPRRCAYVVCVGGRKFTDGEASYYSSPIELSESASGEVL
ncbi:hypothetical protein A5695_25240 [Mycobacterium sp. E1747]|nr:hypothetical protein A5695_25240 [Mycobacterium sp. E1747]